MSKKSKRKPNMETVEQILREMREDIDIGDVPFWADFGCETPRAYVARLEAAIKREREAVGNAAKMRKAETEQRDSYRHAFNAMRIINIIFTVGFAVMTAILIWR